MAFCIVVNAAPIFELDFASRGDLSRGAQFLLHGALDMVDMTMWSNNST